jgi:cobalt transporter subunit CbtB
MMSQNVASAATDASRRAADRFVPILAAAAIGVVLLLGAGFTQTEVMHNAAHDVRHAFAFPCH